MIRRIVRRVRFVMVQGGWGVDWGRWVRGCGLVLCYLGVDW